RRPALYRMRLEGRVAGRWRAAGAVLLKLAGAEELRVGWFTAHDAGIRPLPPQNATDARNGASGAVASYEIIQARASEIIHDLARRGHFVNVRICFGFKLTGKEPAIGFGQFHGLLVHAETLERTRSQDDLGPEHPHQLAALNREAVGHRDDKRITLLGADDRQADAGIAARRLNDGLPRFEQAAPFRIFDNVEREPVLDRTCRVEELGLDVDRGVLDAQIIDPDRWRVPDRIKDAVEQPAPACGGAYRFLNVHAESPVVPLPGPRDGRRPRCNAQLVRGSSWGLTYSMPKGPMALIWTTVSSSVQAKWASPVGI